MDILNILVQALEENEISFKTLYSGSKFQVKKITNLYMYKRTSSVVKAFGME
jgi:hypothetical protein